MQAQEWELLFRPICSSKRGESLRVSEGISNPCLSEQFKRKLNQLGYNAEEFGLHSLRAGGATVAANASVPDCNFKRHERWKSQSAKDCYVEDSLQSRLSVSKRLGV